MAELDGLRGQLESCRSSGTDSEVRKRNGGMKEEREGERREGGRKVRRRGGKRGGKEEKRIKGKEGRAKDKGD